jgi:uncharacterized protein with NRDE domain
MGVTTTGKFAAVTNYRDHRNKMIAFLFRHLPLRYSKKFNQVARRWRA